MKIQNKIHFDVVYCHFSFCEINSVVELSRRVLQKKLHIFFRIFFRRWWLSLCGSTLSRRSIFSVIFTCKRRTEKKTRNVTICSLYVPPVDWLIDRVPHRTTDHLFDWLIDWLIVWLFDCLIDRLIDWLIDRLTIRLFNRSIDWLIDGLTIRLTVRLIDWLIIDWSSVFSFSVSSSICTTACETAVGLAMPSTSLTGIHWNTTESCSTLHSFSSLSSFCWPSCRVTRRKACRGNVFFFFPFLGLTLSECRRRPLSYICSGGEF